MVLAVLSIVVGLFAANLTLSPYKLLTREAQRLQAVLNQASDEAIMQGVELALAVSRSSYQIVVFNAEQLNWEALSEKPFQHYEFSESIQFELKIMDGSFSEQRRKQTKRLQKQSSSTITPSILLLSSGQITPFTVTFSMAGYKERISLLSDGFSGIEIR